MRQYHDYDDNHYNYDIDYEDHGEDLIRKKQVKRMLDARLERKRLRRELADDFDDEFDWGDFDK